MYMYRVQHWLQGSSLSTERDPLEKIQHVQNCPRDILCRSNKLLSQLSRGHCKCFMSTYVTFKLISLSLSLFLSLPPSLHLKMVRKVYREIISLRPPNLNRVGIQKPARLLQQSGLKEKWVRREISTFDYLIQLNTIAGRTYNDLNQYPIVSQLLILISKTTSFIYYYKSTK